VQAELEQLLILQNRQQKIKQIQTEIRTIPQQRQSLEAQLAANAAALTAVKSRGQHLEMDRKKLELDAGTRRESINRLKTQQYERSRRSKIRSSS
jgi:glucose-6-phosphate dehydrogenase assembly protein OpcA